MEQSPIPDLEQEEILVEPVVSGVSEIGPPKEIPRKKTRSQPESIKDLPSAVDPSEMKEARKFPDPPGLRCNFNQLNDWLVLLTDAMWGHLIIYMYRRYPIIVRKQADPDLDNYIDVITKEHVSAGLDGYIRGTHGGGRYRFVCNDTDKRTASTIIDAHMDISTDEVMPKFDLAELDMSHKTNMGYINLLVSKGIIDRKGMPVQPQPVVGDNGANTRELAGMMKDVLGMFMTLNDKQQNNLAKIIGDKDSNKGTDFTQLLLEKMKQEDPNKQFTLLSTLMKEMREMIPTPIPAKDDSNMWQMLLKMQSDSNDKQMALMTKIIEMKSTPPDGGGEKKGLFTELKELIGLKEVLPGLFGGQPEGKKSTPELIIDGVKELGLPVLGLVSQMFQARGFKPIVPVTQGQAEEMLSQHQPMSGRVNQPSQAVQQENQRQRILQMPTTTNQPNPSSGQPTQQAATPSPGQPLPIDPSQLSITQKIFMQFGGMLVTAIKSGKSGAEIGELLQANQMFFGDDIYAILKGQGYEQIIGTMKAIPEFWNQTGAVLGDAHMEQLVKEFLNYEEFLEADDGEEEGEGLPSAT